MKTNVKGIKEYNQGINKYFVVAHMDHSLNKVYYSNTTHDWFDNILHI